MTGVQMDQKSPMEVSFLLVEELIKRGAACKWARTNALILPFARSNPIERYYRSSAGSSTGFPYMWSKYFSSHMSAEEAISSRISTGIPIAPVKAYGVTQVWLQLAVSRFLAWLYWTCTYRYVGALVRWLLT